MSEELQKLLSLEARMDRLEKLLLIAAKEDLTPEEAACRCQPTRIVFSAGIYKHLL